MNEEQYYDVEMQEVEEDKLIRQTYPGIFQDELSLNRYEACKQFHRTIAVWSQDTKVGAEEIISEIVLCGGIADIFDKWSTKRLKKWIGALTICETRQDALTAFNRLQWARFNGRWPIKVTNIGQWLEVVSDIEVSLEPGLLNQRTTLKVFNLNPSADESFLRSLFAFFGPIDHMEAVEGTTTRPSFFQIKYINTVDAYAAELFLDGRREDDVKLEAKVLKSPKVVEVQRAIAKKDMLLWERN